MTGKKPRNSFTIEELIAELQDVQRTAGPRAMVYFEYDYGDHWHTRVAAEIQMVEEGSVSFSDYHSMNKVSDEDAEDDTSRPAIKAILLRSN